MVLRRLLGGSAAPHDPDAPSTPAAAGPSGETATVRRIVASLEALPVDERRRIAAFAYVLGRAAHADLDVTPEETALIERAVVERGGLTEAQAVLVVEIARSQAELYGATEDYLVTREFARLSAREDRERLLRTAFAVAGADDSISAVESAELEQIGRELGFAAPEIAALRAENRELLSSVQALRRMRPDGEGSGR